MFRTLICPSSSACDYSVELPHWSCVLGSMCVGVSVWLGWSGIRVPGFGDSLRAGGSGDRIPVGARFSTHVQTGGEAHPASYTMSTRSSPGAKAAGA